MSLIYAKNWSHFYHYGMQQNLQSLLVHGHKLLKNSDFRYKKCSQKNCSLCAYSNNDSFILLKDKFYLPIMHKEHTWLQSI